MPSDQRHSCFVIAPIGEKDSEVRKRSDKVLKHVFKKALSDKFKVTRADEITEPGMITSQVLRAVQDSDLVVADLTGHNPNVFYELAVRHAIEKPIVHLIEPRLSKIPFDVGGFRTIEFDLTDPDSIESAVDQLKKQADHVLSGNKWGETPVRLARLMQPATGDSPELLLLKQAVEGISNISSRLTRLEVNSLSSVWAQNSTRLMNLETLAGSFVPAGPSFTISGSGETSSPLSYAYQPGEGSINASAFPIVSRAPKLTTEKAHKPDPKAK